MVWACCVFTMITSKGVSRPMACTFWTSQLPKVIRARQFSTLLTSKCASRHNALHFFNIAIPKVVRAWGAFSILTSKSALRHDGMQFLMPHTGSLTSKLSSIIIYDVFVFTFLGTSSLVTGCARSVPCWPLQWGQPAGGIAFDQFFLSLFMGPQVKGECLIKSCVTCTVCTIYAHISYKAWSSAGRVTEHRNGEEWSMRWTAIPPRFPIWTLPRPRSEQGRGHRESTENSFSGCSLMFLTQILLAIMTILGISADISSRTSLNTVLLLNIFQASPVRCPISRPFPRTDPLWSIALYPLGMWYFSAFFHLCFSLVIKVYKLYINVVMDSHGCEDARVCKSSNPPARWTKRRRCFKSPAGQPPAWKKWCFHSLCWGDFHFFFYLFYSILIFIDLHYFPANTWRCLRTSPPKLRWNMMEPENNNLQGGDHFLEQFCRVPCWVWCGVADPRNLHVYLPVFKHGKLGNPHNWHVNGNIINTWVIFHCHVWFATWHARGRFIASWWIMMQCFEEVGRRSISACLVLVQHARLRAARLWLAHRVPGNRHGHDHWVSAKMFLKQILWQHHTVTQLRIWYTFVNHDKLCIYIYMYVCMYVCMQSMHYIHFFWCIETYTHTHNMYIYTRNIQHTHTYIYISIYLHMHGYVLHT